jgi:DNA-binding beta-propeller fold protein YncE
MLPQLRQLEETYPDDVVVIGVHSPKFPAERDLANVRTAVVALEVDHPVVNDPDHRIWDAYAVRAWPTLMFVDPLGRVIAKQEGELRFPALGDVVGTMLQQVRATGAPGYEMALPLRPEPRPTGPLAFPGKVLADATSGRLIVSDSGHHRLVVTRLDGAGEVRVIGRGVAGFSNGDGAARFNTPQGLALDGETLYVADTTNHAIRRIDLGTGAVSTIAGTGVQAERFHRGGAAHAVELNSPWDLALAGDRRTLYVAMAGFHQIWALDLASGLISPYSGTGHEGIRDDVRSRAWHAQPSGLWLADATLYVADSETSAVRAVETAGPAGRVRTLVGSGLFDFGDQDGPGPAARMQHVLGVCVSGGAVWVADSYNNKLRKIDLGTGYVSTAAGNGAHGLQDGTGETARLWAPSGLSTAGGKLYVADTNNHAIRVFDPASGDLATLRIDV